MKGQKLLFAVLGLSIFGYVHAYRVVFKNSIDGKAIVKVQAKMNVGCGTEEFTLNPDGKHEIKCSVGKITDLTVLPAMQSSGFNGKKFDISKIKDGKMYEIEFVNGALSLKEASADVASSTISVKNISSTPVYVAVYEEFSGQTPRRFGSPILVNKGATVNVLRPEWSVAQRANLKNNRNLYIAAKKEQLPEIGRPYHSKDFMNVGNLKGKAFFVYGKEFDKDQHGISFGASASEKDAQKEQTYQNCLWMRDHSQGYHGTCTR